MSRVHGALPALVALLAACAVSASAAQASPTYFTCTTVAGTGEYAGPECAKHASSPHTGQYERTSAVGASYTSRSSTVTFRPSTGATVTCKSSTDTGTITGASTDEDRVVYELCTTAGKTCTSPGEKPGRIATNALVSELVGTEASPEVKFAAAPGLRGLQFEANCSGLLIRVKGYADGRLTAPEAGHATTAQTLQFNGEETLKLETSSDEGLEWQGPYPTGETTAVEDKSATPVGLGSGGEGEQTPSATGSVDGVVEAGLLGVEGAIVTVCKAGSLICGEAETLAGGFYEVPELEPGSYEATVAPPAESAYEAASSGRFSVSAEAESTENFTLTKAPTGSLEGTITDTSAPGNIAGAILTVCEIGGAEACYSTESGANGSYQLPEVRTGSYTAQVEGPFEGVYEPTTTATFTVTSGVETVENVGLKEEPNGSLEGVVQSGSTHTGVESTVFACQASGRCFNTQTNASGAYEFAKLPLGSYTVTAYPDAGYNPRTAGPVTVSAGQETVANIVVAPPGVPPGTTITSSFGETQIGGTSVPVVNWRVEAPITTKACVGGTVSVTITGRNTITGNHESTPPVLLSENPSGSGTFTGKLPAVYPIHGNVTVTIEATGCPQTSEEESKEFEIYVDPSGQVVDGDHGDAPVSGATVTLLASKHLDGPFTPVANGSAVMSPSNRSNPSTTNGEGAFGWDTVPGFYEVAASKPGCGTATSAPFRVPPPKTGLRLVLHCSTGLKVETTTLPKATRGARYETTLVAYGGKEPYKWKKVGKLPKGLALSQAGVLSGTPSTKLAAGEYTIEVSVKESAKPKHAATRKLELDIS